MLISLIAWMAKNRTIGKDNKLPWHYPEDLQYFKKTTSWFPIIMWLKTYYSIGRPLPNRRNIVLSSQEIQIEWVEIFHSIPELLETVKDEKEIFVIW
jgi:dihydrofolate reductase